MPFWDPVYETLQLDLLVIITVASISKHAYMSHWKLMTWVILVLYYKKMLRAYKNMEYDLDL